MLLTELRPETPRQTPLSHQADPRERALMAAIDSANARFGTEKVHLACVTGSMKQRSEAWQMSNERRSPRYTTEWSELLHLEK